ncbi:GNAT family N-acetyltransferase [Streptomyces sp. NPDC020747]|uniref:GNAT family N-acetyltransferase n=1 Tax=Streptomyces sp. NPDC020747 TaxID=3365086 RepID=UPI00378DA3C0
MQTPEATNGAAIRISPVSPQNTELLASIVALGDRFRSKLGFLPPAVYEQAAGGDTLLAAVAGSDLVGYALYGLPGQRIRLTHLCVDPGRQRGGVARLLVDEITRRHQDRLGIILRCRKDYGYEQMWTRLGFEPRDEVDGRGKNPKPLVVWWRDHGHADLLTDLESTALLTVAMDCNVFADLHASNNRTGSQETQALGAEWLTGLVDLVVMPELVAEINQIPQQTERRSQLRVSSTYKRPRPDRQLADQLVPKLITAAKEKLGITLPAKPNDLSDLRYVAEAGAAGVPYVVTRDDDFLRLSEVAQAVCNVRILRPSDVVLHLDELRRAQLYQPGRLLGTSYTTRAVAAGREQEQLIFLNKPGGERLNTFRARLRELAAQPGRWDRQQIVDDHGQLFATYCHGQGEEQLQVPLLRVVDGHALSETIARQILFLLRQHCRAVGAQALRLTDPHLPSTVRAAAQEDGFQPLGDDLIAFVLDKVTDTKAVDEHAAALAGQLGLELPRLQAPLPAAAASAVERAWWPLKITDAELPTFLVPIKPKYAYDLFGVPEGLLARNDELGLSREHVYYRAARSSGEKVPSRILWYASADPTLTLSSVIACSRFDATVVDDISELHQRFQHLGVWNLADVLKHCEGHDQARAIRFSDTEIFSNFVPYKRLKQLARRQSHTLNVQSVFKISSALFQAIYEEGRSAR